MKYIGIIKQEGIRYFFVAVWRELKKKWFVTQQRLFLRHPNKTSHSQYAEDLFIDRVLGYKEQGTYIDIGANHPSHLSNTKRFYDRGWHGVNVEPNAALIRAFETERTRDKNVNVGVGPDAGEMMFYRVEPHTLSTFSAEVAQKLEREGYTVVEKVRVPIVRLAEIFQQLGLPSVDFMSIDTEGYDLEVLMSNDWNTYRARVLCIEVGKGADRYVQFLTPFGYKKIGHNGLNVFFKDIRS